MRRVLLLAVLTVAVRPSALTFGEPTPEGTTLRFRLETRAPALLRFDDRVARERLGGGEVTGPLEVWFAGARVPAGEPIQNGTTAAYWQPPLQGAGPWILEVRPGLPGGSGPAALIEDDPKKVAVERFEVRDDVVHGPVASGAPEVYDRDVPHAYLAKLPRGGRVEIPFALPAPGPIDDATIRWKVEIVGTHLGEAKVVATWGSAALGTGFAPSVAGGAVLAFSCAAKDAPAAGSPATLVLRDETPTVAPSGDPDDGSDDVGAIWVDAVVAEAPMKPHAGPLVALGGDVRVRLETLDVTDRLVPHRAGPDPFAAARGSDELILATAPLLAGARRLAEHRTRTGTKAVVVPIEDVWDAVSGGQPSGDALRRFVLRLRAEAQAPGMLLLAGDADRDRPTPDTIPTLYARTVYNGATASDRRLSADPASEAGALPTGRLPFRDPKALDAYVDRVIRAETKPPLDDSRRAMKFITSEGRFGPQIDMLLENLFANVVATVIPKGYDVEVTFARAGSPWGWPAPDFNRHVVSSLNDGAIFFTYVGHGWWNGFDSLRVDGRRYPILRVEDVPQVDVHGTPPAMFVIACTTALFDDPAIESVGERLLARPNGPLAYWGATRVCHPAWNSLVGRQLAIEFKDPSRPLGATIEAAISTTLSPAGEADLMRRTIENGARLMLKDAKVDVDRLKPEGAAMYVLLGDPAIRLPFPKDDLSIEARRTPTGVEVAVRGAFPDGTEVAASVEVPRNVNLPYATDPKLSPEENMRRRHDRANDKAIARGTAKARGGVASFAFEVPEGRRDAALIAKAHAAYGDDVHLGAIPVP